MAGPGAMPKSPDRKAGHSSSKGLTVLAFQPVGRQAMPDDLLGPDEMWHPATVRWWDRWASSPLVETWTAVDWSEFEACAVLHHEFMKKRTFTLASEIRLRMQKFGATPEDRARLRIAFADADERDDKRQSRQAAGARERRGGLKASDAVEAG